MGGFHWFMRRYLRRHFHSVAINRENLDTVDISARDSLVVYANHASWWDPLAAMFAAELVLPQFRMYAPIDAHALSKYRMFAKMGFFPVDQSSQRGAADFLRTSRAILSQPGASIWITPEGRFVDPRDDSAKLMPGLSHLAAKVALADHQAAAGQTQNGPRIWFVSGGVEYTFWEERQPELLIWFGKPLCAAGAGVEHPESKQQWHLRLTESLRSAQRELAAAAIARDASRFELVLGGSSGTFFLYDIWRKLRARLTGTKMNVDHSDKLSRD